MANSIRYLVFDIESVADAPLVAKLHYPGQAIEPAEAVRRYRAELMAKYDNDFIPYTFHLPITVAVGKVDADFRLSDVVLLDEPQFRPHVMTDNFWRGWENYHRPTLVSFNGRGFDLPLLELVAFRYGAEPAGLVCVDGKGVRPAPQPLQHQRPHRPLRAADQFRQHAIHRRPEPGGQSVGQARQDGRPRRHGAGHARRRPARGDQRLLPLRRVGHLFCFSPQPGDRRAIGARRRSRKSSRKRRPGWRRRRSRCRRIVFISIIGAIGRTRGRKACRRGDGLEWLCQFGSG